MPYVSLLQPCLWDCTHTAFSPRSTILHSISSHEVNSINCQEIVESSSGGRYGIWGLICNTISGTGGQFNMQLDREPVMQ